MANGGPFDCYPLGWTPAPPLTSAGGTVPWPPYYVGDPIAPQQTTAPPALSIQEQLGTDPISKLAAAIEKLADALLEGNRD